MNKLIAGLYHLGYINYLNSERSKENDYAVIGFIGLIEHFIKVGKQDWIIDKWHSVDHVIEKIIERETTIPTFIENVEFGERIIKFKKE